MPTPIVQTRLKSDDDDPRLGEEARRAYHRCLVILRHLLRICPDIALLAFSGDADLRRLRRSTTLRESTKGQSFQTLSSGEGEYSREVTTTEEALHTCRGEYRSSCDCGVASPGIIQRQGCGPLTRRQPYQFTIFFKSCVLLAFPPAAVTLMTTSTIAFNCDSVSRVYSLTSTLNLFCREGGPTVVVLPSDLCHQTQGENKNKDMKRGKSDFLP